MSVINKIHNLSWRIFQLSLLFLPVMFLFIFILNSLVSCSGNSDDGFIIGVCYFYGINISLLMEGLHLLLPISYALVLISALIYLLTLIPNVFFKKT